MLRLLSSLLLALFVAAAALPSHAQVPAGTLKKLADKRKLTLGYRLDAAPFSFQAPDGSPAGYSVDLCRHVAASLQQQLKLPRLDIAWVPVGAADRIGKVTRGEVDLECGTTTVTLGRMAQVDFSSLIFVDSGSFVSLVDGPRSIPQLAGRTVGVLAGSTSEARLQAALRVRMVGATVVRLGNEADAIRALVDKRIDAFANDRLALIGRVMLAQPEGAAFALSEDDYSIEPYALMMRRDPAFRLAVNRALAQIYAGPVLEEVYGAWFGKFGAPAPLLAAMYVLHAYDE